MKVPMKVQMKVQIKSMVNVSGESFSPEGFSKVFPDGFSKVSTEGLSKGSSEGFSGYFNLSGNLIKSFRFAINNVETSVGIL